MTPKTNLETINIIALRHVCWHNICGPTKPLPVLRPEEPPVPYSCPYSTCRRQPRPPPRRHAPAKRLRRGRATAPSRSRRRWSADVSPRDSRRPPRSPLSSTRRCGCCKRVFLRLCPRNGSRPSSRNTRAGRRRFSRSAPCVARSWRSGGAGCGSDWTAVRRRTCCPAPPDARFGRGWCPGLEERRRLSGGGFWVCRFSVGLHCCRRHRKTGEENDRMHVPRWEIAMSSCSLPRGST